MRILLITEFFPDLEKKVFSGGVEARTFFIAKNLSKRHKVTVLCRGLKGKKKKEIAKNLKIIRLGSEINDVEAKFCSILIRLVFVVQSFIKGLKIKSDLIEGSNFICFIPAFLIAKFTQKPAVAWYPDLLKRKWIKNFGLLTGISGEILEWIGTKLPWDRIIALSKETRAKLFKAGMDKRRIRVIYAGVDLEFIKKIKEKKFSQPTICCVSRLVPYKNVGCLIEAIRLIKLDIPEVNCLIIGKGPEEEKLKRLAKKLDLGKDIIFEKDLGYDELIKTLKSSHLFCLPSEVEGFGLSLIEAATCGLPFVASNIKILREVTKSKGGLFFKVKDWQDLAEKVVKVLKDRKLYDRLAKETFELAKNYDWQKIAKETEEIYKLSTLKHRRSPMH